MIVWKCSDCGTKVNAHTSICPICGKSYQPAFDGEPHIDELEENDVRFIVEHYGGQHQLQMLQEELAELIQAISKYQRSANEVELAAAIDKVAEETADVEIMLKQSAIIMRYSEPEFTKIKNKYIYEKIERQYNHIQGFGICEVKKE